MRLTVSIVTFRSDPVLFSGTLQALADSIAYAKSDYPSLQCELYLVAIQDNTMQVPNPEPATNCPSAMFRQLTTEVNITTI